MWDRSTNFSVLLLFLVCVFFPWIVLGDEQQTDTDSPQSKGAFTLQERSVFEIKTDAYRHELTRGARATCQDQPYAAVKVYPEFRSKKPIYGLVRLAPEPNRPDSGTPLYFAVDESGDNPTAVPPASEESADSRSLMQRLGAALFGSSDENEVDEPLLPQLKNTYDRLYVDLNGDLDLTNDRVVIPMKTPPAGAEQRYVGLVQSVVFDEISVPLDFGPDLGKRPVRLVPRLGIQRYEGKDYSGVEFISSVAREGEIRIGTRPYHAVLAQSYVITGRYDRPYSQLLLSPRDNPNERESWWGAEQLNAMRFVDGQYYATSTTPLGDQLFVKPYDGDCGILKIGSGDRSLDRLSIQGSLTSSNTSLAVGEQAGGSSGALVPVAQCRLPVGDYMPNYVVIEFGRLRLGISQNYHLDGKPRGGDYRTWVYGIKIRKDEPFVWDFSNPPEVMFASPAKDQAFHRGDEISVQAVLIDPRVEDHDPRPGRHQADGEETD